MTSPRIALPLVVTLNALFAGAVIEYELHHLHDENALLETLQALALALGAAWFALSHQTDPIRLARDRILAVLCFSFLLREVDVELLPIPTLLQTLGSGGGRVAVLLVLWIMVLAGIWRLYRRDGPGPILQSNQPAIMAGVFALLMISLVMDKQWLPFALPRLWEELAETNAYLLLVAGHAMRWGPAYPRLTAPS